jgi:hypothetical protein
MALKRNPIAVLLSAALAAAAAGLLHGCDPAGGAATKPADPPAVPEPIDLLLPREIRLHPFTGTRTFSDAGGVTGIDVRVEALDAFGDATKAFGDFRFELYAFQPNSTDPKGDQLAIWPADVSDPEANRAHWNHINHTYQFKLKWTRPIPVGTRYVLRAVFQSPYTERLFDERVFVSGE